MNKQKNSPVKILTDIKIEQSHIWGEKTDYLGEIKLRNGVIQRLLPEKVKGLIYTIFETVNIIKKHHKYDVIVTAHIRGAQLFALFRKLFNLKRPKHIILELMLDENKDDLIWKVKKKIQQYIFSSVDLIFVSSTSEIATYSKRLKISEDSFKFLPFHTNIINPRIIDGDGGYILSAGKTGRDYLTLATATEGIGRKVIIVSDKVSVQGIKFSDNVKILIDIPYSKYLDLLYNCYIAVIPLKKMVKSTGQVAILEAMALGKPVIATRTTGTVDYIQSGINGVLVPAGDAEALKDAIINLTNDKRLYKNLSVNALESVKKNHTFDIYTSRILEAVREISKK